MKLKVLIAAGLLAAQACSSLAPSPTPELPVGEPTLVSETPFVEATAGIAETAVVNETPFIEETAPPGQTGETPVAGAEIPVSFENISFVIPSGLATGADPQAMPAVGENEGAPWEIAPAHTRITLEGYPLQGKLFEPHILVYPAQEYAASSHPSAEQSLERLRQVISETETPLNDEIPGVPMFNAAKPFGAQIAKINTQNGTGIRLLTEYAQDVTPISNQDLIYQFQGLTNDGNYYIIANLPVNASFLAADEMPGSPLPEGGIPFPDLNTTDADQINAYVQAVTDRLNAESPGSFQPSLEQLDALVQSIQVSP